MPPGDQVLVDREDGGNLVVNPPRDVWERCELSADELRAWGCLVAAAGFAMLEELPQLAGGCINYWEAGNWALNEQAPPVGPKQAPAHRRVHLHLLGRSVNARSVSWRWGEAPMFPAYVDRKSWASQHRRLTAEECSKIVRALASRLLSKYGFQSSELAPLHQCTSCHYPVASDVPVSACSACAQ